MARQLGAYRARFAGGPGETPPGEFLEFQLYVPEITRHGCTYVHTGWEPDEEGVQAYWLGPNDRRPTLHAVYEVKTVVPEELQSNQGVLGTALEELPEVREYVENTKEIR